MVKPRIGYFLDDIAQANFIRALVARVAREQKIDWIDDQPRASSGGKSEEAYRSFLKQLRPQRITSRMPFDLLVVAIDGNCKGYSECKSQLAGYAITFKYPQPDRIVYAIPDPLIERWYLADPSALAITLGSQEVSTPSPACKERQIYKDLIVQSIRSTGIEPQYRGAEYGERVVENMDLYKAGKNDASLKHFLEELAAVLKQLKQIDAGR